MYKHVKVFPKGLKNKIMWKKHQKVNDPFKFLILKPHECVKCDLNFFFQNLDFHSIFFFTNFQPTFWKLHSFLNYTE